MRFLHFLPHPFAGVRTHVFGLSCPSEDTGEHFRNPALTFVEEIQRGSPRRLARDLLSSHIGAAVHLSTLSLSRVSKTPSFLTFFVAVGDFNTAIGRVESVHSLVHRRVESSRVPIMNFRPHDNEPPVNLTSIRFIVSIDTISNYAQGPLTATTIPLIFELMDEAMTILRTLQKVPPDIE